METVGKLPFRFGSLEDFLASKRLTFDAEIEHGVVHGLSYAAKGREIDAAILFADLSAFTRRTRELSPIATLFLVNHFFTYISAAALRFSSAIVDKYIGDEIMVAYFGASRSPISVDRDQRFRLMPITDFGLSRSLISEPITKI